MRLAAAIFAGVIGVSCASAQDLVLPTDQGFFDPLWQARAEVCHQAAFSTLVEKFAGIERVEIAKTNIWDGAIGGVQFIGLPNVAITSESGAVQAEIICLVQLQPHRVFEVAFQFEPGLTGDRQSRVPVVVGSSVVQINTPIEVVEG